MYRQRSILERRHMTLHIGKGMMSRQMTILADQIDANAPCGSGNADAIKALKELRSDVSLTKWQGGENVICLIHDFQRKRGNQFSIIPCQKLVKDINFLEVEIIVGWTPSELAS